jgi:hypothetical protein
MVVRCSGRTLLNAQFLVSQLLWIPPFSSLSVYCTLPDLPIPDLRLYVNCGKLMHHIALLPSLRVLLLVPSPAEILAPTAIQTVTELGAKRLLFLSYEDGLHFKIRIR